jgi:ADP-heptose:LPS heptosyltransferase
MLTPSPHAPPTKIAIYRTSSLGDVVLATACLDLLSKLPIPVEITWIGRGAALDVIQASWPQTRIIPLPRSATLTDIQKVGAQLSDQHLIIDLQCNLRSQWLCLNLKNSYNIPSFSADKAQLSRSRLLVEARVRGRRKPLPEKSLQVVKFQYDMMCDALKRALRHHLPVEMLDGLDLIAAAPRLPIPDSFDSPWRKELRFGAWVGVAPGAAHPTKQTPLEIVKEILDGLAIEMNGDSGHKPTPLGLVFLGDNNDRQSARHILDSLNWQGPVLNLCGMLSLWETGVALSEATCLLSNDSSLGHIAEAVGTPTAILFGPTIESFGFAPRMRRSQAFSALTGCRPCSKHGKVACRYGDKLCFHSIPTPAVIQHLHKLLTSPDARHINREPHKSGPGPAGPSDPHVHA